MTAAVKLYGQLIMIELNWIEKNGMNMMKEHALGK